MRTYISILLLLSTCTSYAQDYREYYRILYRIDDDVLAGNYNAAIARFDSVRKQYPFITAQHCLKALQICSKAEDSIRSAYWLSTALQRGMPLYIIRKHELSAKALSWSNCAYLASRRDSLYNIYRNSIDTTVAKKLDRLYTIDQRRTRRVNDGFVPLRYTIYGLQWLHNNHKQFRVINEIAEEKGYPGERLAGISARFQDSAFLYSFVRFRGGAFLDPRAYIMLVHYYSNAHRQPMDSILMQGVRSGNISPRDCAVLYEYQSLYGKNKKEQNRYYHEWTSAHIGPDEPENIVDARRYEIGLYSLAVQKRNDEIELQRRKDKTSRSEIMLE